MKIHHLKPAPGAHQRKTRKGRGMGSGRGGSSGRGTKGTGARDTVPPGFEGGQMPLARRLPKRPGFTNPNRVAFAAVNVGRLGELFDDGDEVTPEALRRRGLVGRKDAPVKILGEGELGKQLTVAAHAFSGTARAKIEQRGGTVTVLPRRPTAPETP